MVMSIWATNQACTIDGKGSVLLGLSDMLEVILNDVKYVSSIWKTSENSFTFVCYAGKVFRSWGIVIFVACFLNLWGCVCVLFNLSTFWHGECVFIC